MLQRMPANLPDNAIKYSEHDSCITVGVNAQTNAIQVSVRDEGIGISPEKLPRIFEEHYRAKEAVQHNKESSGLGLSIVKHVAEIYRIHIHVESCVGSGTTFELTFPTLDESLKE